MMKPLTLFLLALIFASQGWGQVQMDRIAPKGVNKTFDASQLCNGSTDLTVCVNNAIALLPNASGCTPSGNSCKQGKILLDGFAGTIPTQATTLTINSPYLQILGPGSANLVINCTPNADCWNVRANSFSVTMGARIGGFSIVGQGLANASANGIHTGDLTGAEFFDIQIDNFLGANSSCFWVDNQLGWFERNVMYRIQTGIHGAGIQNGCTKGRRFTVNGGQGSFGYNQWIGDKVSLVNSGGIGWSVEGGTIYSNYIETSGNQVAGTTYFKFTAGSHTGNDLYERTESTGAATGFNMAGGTFYYHGFINYASGNITDTGSIGSLQATLPGEGNTLGMTAYLWPSGGSGETICNGPFGQPYKSCIQRSEAANNSFTLGFLVNGYFDNVANLWHFDTDATNNGGFGLVSSYSGGATFVNVPTNTPASAQTITTANLLNNFAAASIDTSNNWLMKGKVTAAGLTASGTSLTTLGQTTVASLPSAASNPGAMILVTDSTAVASEGQTCTGGSSNKAVAISNGSSWKCF